MTHLNEHQSQGWSVLQVLNLKTNRLSGSLPGSWGGSLAAFPNLTLLALDDNQIKGSLPAAWSAGWPSLSYALCPLLMTIHILLVWGLVCCPWKHGEVLIRGSASKPRSDNLASHFSSVKAIMTAGLQATDGFQQQHHWIPAVCVGRHRLAHAADCGLLWQQTQRGVACHLGPAEHVPSDDHNDQRHVCCLLHTWPIAYIQIRSRSEAPSFCSLLYL